MSYILLFIGFFATIIALFETSGSKEKEEPKVKSAFGRFALLLAGLALFFGIIKQCSEQRADNRKTKMLSELKLQADSLNEQLSFMGVKILAYEDILHKLHSESERQPQWTFVDYLVFEPNKEIDMPNKIFSGSLLKFNGICGKLKLRYGNKEIIIPDFGYFDQIEIPISGPSGKGFHWSVENIGSTECNAKIYVLSTPRSRSNRRSYEEEQE